MYGIYRIPIVHRIYCVLNGGDELFYSAKWFVFWLKLCAEKISICDGVCIYIYFYCYCSNGRRTITNVVFDYRLVLTVTSKAFLKYFRRDRIDRYYVSVLVLHQRRNIAFYMIFIVLFPTSSILNTTEKVLNFDVRYTLSFTSDSFLISLLD